ncbi:uncharacterized protein DFL_000130 [Arthrobotrys flagrans]|uniref:Manganese lipoxygenase n=1 Tax=Arthrobotrys flagrans TaxID=97331 RepID=A0A437ACV9_ARTFL|nr:hypothetical protein DFL_000130 [Arthrobotrys flagrans]
MKPVHLLAASIATVAAVPIQPLDKRLVFYTVSNPLLQVVRSVDIAAKCLLFSYGPGTGGGPPSPAGVQGLAHVEIDKAITNAEIAAQAVIDFSDRTVANADTAKLNGLQTLDDYTKLYEGNWGSTSAPTGVSPGLLTNYTQDLSFSMQRLSTNPYAVRRLAPGEILPFIVDDLIVESLAGKDLATLLSEGRLFYADHSGLKDFETEESANYAGGCDAYFYISPANGQFLPLAIRTNYQSNLIYTPADTSDDWMLAKIMFNADDLFMAQFYHFSGSHFVSEAIFQAAVRTLSEEHPVLAILRRLMYGAFGIRPLAANVLFPVGGIIDRHFGYSGRAAEAYSTYLYESGISGAVQNNYFKTNLKRRGLIDFVGGPALTHFPFYEDALPLWNATHTFMTALVNTYYANDAAIVADNEILAWMNEANGPAEAVDFPTKATMNSRAMLIDLLTHVAHLVSTAHHVVNTNALITAGAVLPLNPGALFKPIPTAKGATTIADYLPPVDKCIAYIFNTGLFARPLIAGTDRTIVHMFDDPVMLVRMKPAISTANNVFKVTMEARSAVVKNRGFDSNGLSQGMPFVWKTLDPDVAPWSLTV